MRSQAKHDAKPSSAGSITRPPRRLGALPATLLAVLALACSLAVTPASAAAFPEHTPLPELAHTTIAPAVPAIPCGVATDSAGNYYVADSATSGSTAKSITIYAPNGTQILTFSTAAISSTGLCKIAVDSQGRIYTTNSLRNQVLRIKPNGPGSEPDFPPVSGTTYELDTSLNDNGVLAGGLGGGTTNAGSGGAVAIDPATQNVYVTQTSGSEVQEYKAPAVEYSLKCEGKETALLPSGASNEAIKNALEAAPVECKTVTVSAGSPASRVKVTFGGAMANKDIPPLEVIKAGGNEVAYQMFNGSATSRVSSFQPNGTPISTSIGSSVSGANYIGVDVYGKNGNVYATDKGTGHNKAFVFNNAGTTVLAEFNGSDSLAGAFDFSNNASLPAIAVDQSNGHAYVSDIKAHGVIDEFDGAGNFVSQLAHTPAFEEVAPGNGVAVDNGASSPGKGRIYLTARTEAGGVAGANRGVFAFGPLIYGLPLKVTKTGFGTGTVKSVPVGIDCGVTCEAEFETDSTIVLTAQASPGSVFSGWSGCDAIVSGECEVTLDEAREVSANFDSRPIVSEEAASQITDSSVRLEALVNPKGKSTSYRFEYLTEAAYQANGESFSGPQPAGKAPASPVPAGSGTANVAATQKVGGLKASTAYRFRIVATSSVGTTEGSVHSFTTYSPPDVFTGCANESFRTGAGASLPDCRAYEQASPLDKNGSSLQGVATQSTVAAPDGSAISFENPAGLPGGVGAQSFPVYVAKRGSGSWSTWGLYPDASAGIDATVLGWTPDFSLAIDRAGSSAQGSGLFARSTTGDPLVELVPYTSGSNYYYVGASADTSTLIFGTALVGGAVTLIPGDAVGKPNLYAVDRDTGELHLAGVLPDGSTPAEGSAARDPSWEDDTYNQDMHAVSEDGSVFFSNLSSEGQLYLRLNPTQPETPDKDPEGNCIPDPILACTVHVSASQKENGKGPGGHDSAGPQPAILHFATPDSSKAIFSSSEKLTDDANTGAEPDAPSIAKAKAADGTEKDVEFVPAFADQIDIAPTAEYVYWTDPSHNRIGRAKLDGSVVEEDLITGIANLKGVAVVDQPGNEYVYWTTPAAGEDTEVAFGSDESQFIISGEGTIGRAKLDGQNVEPDCLEGIVNPYHIDANSANLFWTSPGRLFSQRAFGLGDVGKASLDCNEISVVQPLVDDDLANGDIVVGANHFYASTSDEAFVASLIARFDLDGTNRDALVRINETLQAAGLAVDAAHLYWSDPDHNRIGRSDLDGSDPSEEPSFIPEAGRPSDLALDATHIYWAANQGVTANPGNDLYEFDRESGELTDLAVDSSSENGTEVQGVLGASEDGDYVYFAANGIPDGVTGSPNVNGEEALAGSCKGNGSNAKGTCNLYLVHDDEVTFIARLKADALGSFSKEPGDGDAVNWIGGTVRGDEFDGKGARVSEDGQTLLFRSQRQLTAYDNSGSECKLDGGAVRRLPSPCPELYLFQAGEPQLLCISCIPTGAAPRIAARLNSLRAPGPAFPPSPARVMMRNLSDDGKRAFFESTDQLVGADTNGQGGCPAIDAAEIVFTCQDVYEWEAPGKGTCAETSNAYSPMNGGCIYLLSSGKGTEPSYFADASEDGDDVFIFTYDRLVPQDEDGLLDVYDARVNGGLASQHQVAAVPCEGEACKGPASSAPASSSPGSPSFTGPGNQSTQRKPPRTRCPKGSRRVRRQGKPRCVKRVRNHKRAANANRRAGR